MANSRIYFKSEAGGTTTLSRDTSANSGNLVLPASGNIASVDTAVTDNAIARFDSTTGKLQNSGVVIDDNNNVGIGVTPSAIGTGCTALQIKNCVNFVGTTGVDKYELTNAYFDGAAWRRINATQKPTKFTSYDGNYVWGTAAAGAADSAITFSDAMTLDSSGNIGIGVTPSAWNTSIKAIEQGSRTSLFELNGETVLNNNSYLNTSSQWIRKTANACTMYEQLNGGHYWSTAPSGTAGNTITWTNAMTLDTSNGLNLNTSYAGSYPAVTMFGNASNNYVQILGRNAANNDIVFNSTVGGVIKAAILANGSFQSATNSYGGTSDAKLKENVVETSEKLDKLMNVRVVNFNYIGDDQKQIGVIAQEVEKVFPGIVYETKDTEQVEVTKTKEVTDEEGNVTTEEYTETETVETGEVTKNVKYSVIYMMMLKGMQEQQAIINDLKARIEILEGAK